VDSIPLRGSQAPTDLAGTRITNQPTSNEKEIGDTSADYPETPRMSTSTKRNRNVYDGSDIALALQEYAILGFGRNP